MNEITSLETTEVKVTAVERTIEIGLQSGLTIEEAKGIWDATFSVEDIESDRHGHHAHRLRQEGILPVNMPGSRKVRIPHVAHRRDQQRDHARAHVHAFVPLTLLVRGEIDAQHDQRNGTEAQHLIC